MPPVNSQRNRRTVSTGPGQEPSRPSSSLRPHRDCGVIPRLVRADFEALVADIRSRGIVDPLHVSAEGVVLDGHERLRAACELGLERLPVRVVEPEDERAYMLLAALRRKHLNPGQRAALALELPEIQLEREEARARQRANLKQNTEVANLPPRCERTRERVAGLAGVSPRTVQAVETVRRLDRTLFEQIKLGTTTAEKAARQALRTRREAELPEAPPLPEGPFELIYADPPWQLGSPDSAKAPENHYDTMPLEEIKALEVPACEEAVLFLWAVNCLLLEAFEVLAAWGFVYKAHFAWNKGRWGLGHWVRNQHELLLIGRRGKYPAPEPGNRPGSLIQAERGNHSQKPDRAYELLEQMYPRATKLELFARRARPGWSAWGKEAPR